MIVIIDNYDSFTYNIVQTLGGLGAKMEIFRNDQIDVAGIAALRPDRLLISPGPCDPAQAGVSIAAIKHFAGKIPVLGVCLGHQAIGAAFRRQGSAGRPLDARQDQPIFHDGRGVFSGLPSPFEAMRYHSLVVEQATLPDCLEITARTDQDELMGLRHKTWWWRGCSFIPSRS